MDRDSSDILGQKTMPVARGSSAGSSFTVYKFILISAAILGSYALGKELWQRYLLWRERSYKLATRRRHGIPDSDLRPFNVAYSEAAMKAREEESRKQARPRPSFRPQTLSTSLDQREAQPDDNLRQRSAAAQRSDAGLRSTAVPVPGGYHSVPPPSRNVPDLQSNGHVFTNPYAPKASLPPSGPRPLSRQRGYANIEDALSDSEGKKRSWDDEMDEEHEAKKTRVEGDELIDGGEDAEFDDAVPKRGSKRGIRDEEDSEDVKESKKTRGKRARKVSQEKAYQADQSMDIDEDAEEADEITELKSTSYRGKKRDRAEAGSTFGGDDDESAGEHEADDDPKARRRRRKRRTVAKRKSEATYLRDKQRPYNGEEDGSSDDSSPSKVSARRRRHRRVPPVQRERSKSDVSMDESTTSTRTKVREIGDEWESNGIKYKIGLNGQRLRQALVKKARQKFTMPKDSQHPDRDANLQVCIESWLTEEEYQQAKADHMLAWQDSPGRSEETERLSLDTSHGVQFPQSAPGKNLLWSTSTNTTPTISPASSDYGYVESVKPRSYRDGYRHSIATTVGVPISPFGSSTMPTVKRIASSSRALSLTSSINGSGSPGLSDSTNGSPRTAAPHKVFSKWEKQELEAKAMMKVREANRKREVEKESKLKEERDAREKVEQERAAAAERARQERERAERERQERDRVAKENAERERKAKEAAAAAAAAPAVPSITVTAPSSAPAPTPGATSTPASVPNGFFTNPATGAPKLAQSTSFFNNPAGSTATPAAETKPAPGGFSFAPGGAAPPTTTTPASAPKPPLFAFNSSSGTEQKTDASGSSSLLSRLGQQAPEPSKSTQPAQPTQPMFSFPKPEGSAPPASVFPVAPSTSSNSAPAPSPAAAAGPPKFSFNFANKSGGTGAPTSGNTSTLSGALGGEAKPAASSGPTFSFKTPTTAASGAATNGTTSATTSTTPASAPKFSFGGPSSSTPAASPFGAPKEQPSSPFGTTSTASPFGNAASGSSTSAFGGGTTGSAFGNTSSTPSAFGNSKAPSAFGGGSTTTSAFGGTGNTSSPFGGGAANPSPFGAPSSNPFGGSSTPAATSKPSTFAFGTTPATGTAPSTTTPSGTPAAAAAAAGGSGFSFNFGGAQSSTTPKASPFGVGASAFGGGGAFGAPASGQQK